ncbi:cytochrome P450 [Pseudomassariella vexata]|uniref:Cytochrome P450 n=1 Tax=Pseudomassariella vexata TaxID=1141098 RepID=A0A1Y2DIX6_9PEZI|nr:cytochrome P450 [Pseudomassariella vexata]ORY59181.1 cytochrome P450 [Pseudomassariella vexata]
MAFLTGLIVTSWALSVLYLLKRKQYRDRIPVGAKPLPGPKGLPLIGRVHDVPPEKTWLKFHEWSKEYGPIYQMEMFGSVHVWISSEKIANDLLSRRAVIYSDRPTIPNLPNNRTSGEYLALHGRNETWKRQRKLCQHLMAVSANDSLHDYPTMERDRFLFLLAQDPSQYREYIEQFTARTVSRLSWGSAHPANVLRHTTFGLLETISPAGALPNIVSWLGYLPRFLSPWQQKEYARHELEARMWKNNVKYVHDSINDGSADPSFVRTFIETVKKTGDKAKWGEESEATYVVGQMAIAGALTIGSPIQSFLLAMLHYPQWQMKLQEEIDAVCQGKCPEWSNREQLPMLRAVVKEVIRWRPPVPTGIPHASEKDDVYNGYFIPAGATIHALEWGMTRNEEIYPDAETFNPSRWLDPSYPTYKGPLTEYPKLAGFSQFGFGRRTCQGVPIVEQDLFLAMGGMAWAFNITKKFRADGTEIPVHWNEYSPLLIAKPAPFEFDARPRSEAIKWKLRGMWETGRGEDDIEEECRVREEKLRVRAEHMKLDREREVEADKYDDAASVGGSETSGPSEGGSVSSSATPNTPGGLSVRGDGEVDIWA